MNKTICVYSSSSCAIDGIYFELARETDPEETEYKVKSQLCEAMMQMAVKGC